MCPSSSSPLRRPRIRPGRNGRQVTRRDLNLRVCRSTSLLLCSSGKSTLSLVTFANYKWFEEWKDDKVSNRGAEYKELKQAFLDSILEVVMDVFPKITMEKVTFVPLQYGRRWLARCDVILSCLGCVDRVRRCRDPRHKHALHRSAQR